LRISSATFYFSSSFALFCPNFHPKKPSPTFWEMTGNNKESLATLSRLSGVAKQQISYPRSAHPRGAFFAL
jgi:hypothetical protein